MAGNGPVRLLGGFGVTGRREQSGIANNRPRDCVIIHTYIHLHTHIHIMSCTCT